MFTCRLGAQRLTTLVVAISGMLFSGLESRADDQLTKLPAAVRKTLKLEAAKAEVEDVQKLKSGKSTVWEIDVIQAGKSYELHIAADGTLIHKKLEGADEESGDEAAAKSQNTVKKAKSSAKSPVNHDDDEDAKAESSGQSGDEEEDEADEEEEEDDDEELTIKDLPKAVRNALKREAAGGDIEEIERERENGVTVYEATVEFDSDDEAAEDDQDDGDDDEDDEEDEDEDEIVYELKFSKAGVLLSKILVDDEDEEDDQ